MRVIFFFQNIQNLSADKSGTLEIWAMFGTF